MKKITLLFTVSLLALTAPLASAQDQLHLGWGACRTNGGTLNQASPCSDDFAAAYELIGSMNLATPYANFVAATSSLLATSAAPSVPEWWRLDPQGGCRAGSLSAASSLSGQGCGHPFGTQFNGIVQWFTDPGASGRIIGGYARGGGPLAQVNAATNLITFVFLIDNAHSTPGDPPACAGCQVGMCIEYKELKLEDDPPATTRTITDGGPLSFATWQSVPQCPAVTPTKSSTWGQVKSMYR